MNRRDHDFRIEPAEWQAQESARRAERHGQSGSADPRFRDYRQIACVLARPQPVALPPDFARQMARKAVREDARRSDTRLESRIAGALLAMLGIAALVLALLQGGQWWSALTALVPDVVLANNWLLSLLACIGATFAFGLLVKPHSPVPVRR